MTEADWLTAIDPTPVARSIRGRATVPQMAAASVALCRTNRDLMTHPASLEAVEWLVCGQVSFDDPDGPDDGDCYRMSAAANRCLGVVGAAARGDSTEAHERLTEMLEFLTDDADAESLKRLAAVCRLIFGKPLNTIASQPSLDE